jgi:bacillolysin
MRKNLFFIFVLALFSHALSAQLRPPISKTVAIKTNKLSIDEEAATGKAFSKTILKLPLIDLKGAKTTFETSDFKLKEANPETDPYGLQHYHYTQTINGIEVDGAEMRVHVKNGTVDSQTGSWLLEVTPRLQSMRASQSADAILQAVENSLKGKKISSQTLTIAPLGNSANARIAAIPDNSKLVYVPMGRDFEAISPDSVRLAYRFTVKTGAFGNFMYYVDATSGEVLYKIDLVCRMMGVKAHAHTASCDGTATATDELAGAPLMPTLAPPPPLTETSDPSSMLWTGYNGKRAAVTTKRSDGKWALKDLTRNIEIIHLDSLRLDDNGNVIQEYSVPYLNNSNQWRPKSENDFDSFAQDALWGAQVTHDYYKNTLGKWLYTSGKLGQKLKIYANTDFTLLDPTATNSINAFYSGEEVVIGQGAVEQGVNPLSALDIMAHEITHGVTQATSGLRYINESGAVNEGLSDIFGTAVERYRRPERWNWTMGEDCGIIIRSMSNPRAYEQPSEYGGQYFLNYGLYANVDNGGVHINSGIMNRWFYLLCEGGKGRNEAGNNYEVKGIGMDDAIKIVYLAQRDYITPGMSYYLVSLAAFRAARAIFGQDAPQTQELQKAWLAVNVSKGAIYKNCSDVHEPNNSFKNATAIKVDVPVQGKFS